MQVLHAVEADRIRALLAADEFFWLDLRDPPPDDVRTAGALLALEPLALEDSLELGQRPKLDDYGETVLLVFYGVSGDDPVEVHLHVSGSWLLTVRTGPCGHLEAAKQIVSGVAGTEEEVVARVLDALTDSFLPAVDRIEQEADELEQALLRTPTPAERRRLLERRTDLIRLRQRAVPQRDLLGNGDEVIRRLPGLDVDADHDWLRDVHDHLVTVVQRIDATSEILASALQLHLALVAADQNEVTRRLTVVATIFLPLSVVVGFFGMNFGWLVRHIDSLTAFVGYGLVGMVLSTVGLMVYVRRLQRAD